MKTRKEKEIILKNYLRNLNSDRLIKIYNTYARYLGEPTILKSYSYSSKSCCYILGTYPYETIYSENSDIKEILLKELNIDVIDWLVDNYYYYSDITKYRILKRHINRKIREMREVS